MNPHTIQFAQMAGIFVAAMGALALIILGLSLGARLLQRAISRA